MMRKKSNKPPSTHGIPGEKKTVDGKRRTLLAMVPQLFKPSYGVNFSGKIVNE